MPWLVKDELIAKYSISKQLDPEMEERVRSLRLLREQQRKASKHRPSMSKLAERPGPASTVKYPIIDEMVPVAMLTDPSTWPQPKEFDAKLDVVARGCLGQVLELWQFIHAFSHNLEISPMPLHYLISALEHEGEHNPIVENLCFAFLNQFSRLLRTNKLREERIEQYLGNAPVNELPPFRYQPPTKAADEDGPVKEEDLDAFIQGLGKSRKDAQHWSYLIVEFLWDLRRIPTIHHLICHLYKMDRRVCEAAGWIKLELMMILRNFYITCVSLRPAVDREIDIAADAKHRIRELEADRRKLYYMH